MVQSKIKIESLDKTSRYRNNYKLKLEDGTEKLETYDVPEIKESNDDSYHVVTMEEENRLDLISYREYGNPLLWWVIAEGNGIKDPFNIPAGETLRIPNMARLYSSGGVLSN